jgi:transposase
MTQSIVDSHSLSSSSSAAGARRASAADEDTPRAALPEPEVTVVTARRRFSPKYKRHILEQADRCSAPGEVGALLRREGLYSSHLSKWRQQRDQGVVSGLTPRKRGPKATERSADSVRVVQLERDNATLRAQLEQAELIIEVQKKVSQLLGVSLPKTPRDEDNS